MTALRFVLAGFAALAVVAFAAFLGKPSPDLAETGFVTLEGESFRASDLRGKVVAVSFWATTCGTCLKEIPKLVDRHRKFSPRGYEMLAVAMRHDEPARVTDFARRRALPFKVALDHSGDIARRFGGVRETPTIFVIDRQGRVLKRFRGRTDWAKFDALVEQALLQP
jgi:peroxiredoxin